MPSTAAVVGFSALGVAFLVGRANRARRRSSEEISSGHQVLDVLLGPSPDPCLGPVYTEVAQPLLPEAYANVSPEAAALYGERPVFFIPAEYQGMAFTRLAHYRVNQPFVEPVIKVAQELAPACKWLVPRSEWSPAMVAFHNSLEKMVQIVDVDIGDAPELKRPHAWETEMVLRDGRELALADGSQVSFELPPGTGPLALSATVTPDGGAAVQTLGMHEQKVPNGNGSYILIPVVQLRASLVGSQPATLRIQASRASGDATVGQLELYPKV